MREDRTGISRVVLLYREDAFDAALAAFRDTLGITDFDAPFHPPGLGLRYRSHGGPGSS